MFSKLSKMSTFYRILIVSSTIWIIVVLVNTNPWVTQTIHRYRQVRPSRSGTANNWDDFFLYGILPVIIIWGIIWILQAFKKKVENNKEIDLEVDPSQYERNMELDKTTEDTEMKIKFWGVRGDLPCPGSETVKYGGNTMCTEIKFSDPDRLLIIDAGSGIRQLGNDLMIRDFAEGSIKADILLTHTHWDHIMGLPHFQPIYTSGTKLRIFGPVNYRENTLKRIMSRLFEYDYFQISETELSADIKYFDSKEGTIDLGYDKIKVTAKYLNHPILCLGYRVEYNDKVICTAYDTEPFHNLWYQPPDDPSYDELRIKEGEEFATEQNQEILDFFADADLLIHDAQYTSKEYYESKIGCGHTPMEYAIKSAKKAGVKKLALVHHDPLSTDKKLDELSEQLGNSKNMGGLQVFFAKEGMEIEI